MEADIPTIVTAAFTVAGVALPVVAVYLVKAKGKLSQLRAFVDALDDDLKDNALSEAEYKDLVAKAKALFS